MQTFNTKWNLAEPKTQKDLDPLHFQVKWNELAQSRPYIYFTLNHSH